MMRVPYDSTTKFPYRALVWASDETYKRHILSGSWSQVDPTDIIVKVDAFPDLTLGLPTLTDPVTGTFELVTPPPLPVPAERAAIYNDMLALLVEAGIVDPDTGAGVPTDYSEAIAAMEGYINAQTTTLGVRKASRISTRLLARRLELMDLGGSWAEALRYFGQG